MKKTAVVLSTLMLLASVASCTKTNETTAAADAPRDSDPAIISSNETEVPDDTVPSVSPLVPSSTVSVLEIDYTPEDHGRIIPFVATFAEDQWMPEGNKYTFGLIDMDGNEVCAPVFDSVVRCDELNAYIVRATQDDVSKYGLLSYDGAKFTGLIYDGLCDLDVAGKDGTCFYGSVYDNGNLLVKSIDKDFNVITENSIVIDEAALGHDASKAQLTVSFISDERAYLMNRDEFYPEYFLIDTTNGKVLYKGSALDITEGRMFGDRIVEQDASGKGIKVYDTDGNVVFDNGEAYSWKVCEDEYMIASDGTLNLYDREWNVISSMKIGTKAIVMSSFERIAVCEMTDTKLYDKDLNLIAEYDDVYLGDGTYFRDWYGFGEGDMFFDSISYTHQIYNLNTGARLDKDDDFFYSFEYGYITSDNLSNGNDPVKKWCVYDKDFNLIMEGTGRNYLKQDELTGEVYNFVINEDKLTVYSLAEGEELFSLDYTGYNIYVIGGRFSGSGSGHFFLTDRSGDFLFDREIDHTVLRMI